eukprot:374825_1
MDWNWLHTNYPIIYTQRKAIVDERIKQKLNALSTTIVTDFDNDPNCLIHSYLHHIDKDTDQNVQNERKNLFEFMVNHPNESTENLKYENGSYLHDIHVQALHEMNQINVIVLEYIVQIDQITQQNAYYNSSFQDTLVLFHRPHLNQYDYCRVDYAKSKYYTTYPDGSKYNKLKQFDDTFIHNHEDIQYANYQPPSNVHNHPSPPDKENMNDKAPNMETAIRRIDFCMGMYYIVMGGTHYFDVSHRGKFYKYLMRNKLSKHVILSELNNGVPHHSLFGDFNQFPIHPSWPIHSDKDKRYAIFYIIKYCFTFHRPPSIEYIKSKLEHRQHRADRIAIEGPGNHFAHTVLNCEPLQRLESLMKSHMAFAKDPKHVQHSIDDIDAVDLVTTNNDYLHLLECSNDNKANKELIYLAFGLCEKKGNCAILSRQCRGNKEKQDMIKMKQLYFLHHLDHHNSKLSSEEEQRAIFVFKQLDNVHVTFQHHQDLYPNAFTKKNTNTIHEPSLFMEQLKHVSDEAYDKHDPMAVDEANVVTNAILCGDIDMCYDDGILMNVQSHVPVYDHMDSGDDEEKAHSNPDTADSLYSWFDESVYSGGDEEQNIQMPCKESNNIRQIRSLRAPRYNQIHAHALSDILQRNSVQVDRYKIQHRSDDTPNKACENKAEDHHNKTAQQSASIGVQINDTSNSMKERGDCNFNQMKNVLEESSDTVYDETSNRNNADAIRAVLCDTDEDKPQLKTRHQQTDLPSQFDRRRTTNGSIHDVVKARTRLNNDETNISYNPNGLYSSDVKHAKFEVKKKMYHPGYRFVYNDHQLKNHHGLNQQKNVIYVHPKYKNMKDEALHNGIFSISLVQYEIEVKKARIHHRSSWMRRIWQVNTRINVGHLLSVLFYCNYDLFQFAFSRTYRDHNGSQHSSFYHMGRLLTEAIRFLGTKPTRAWTLYHGINQSMLFESYVHDIQINGPLSTSTSLAVAAQFADNKGMVIALQDGKFNSSCCLDVSPLSDFVNEREVLFVQNPGRLRMVDIFDSVTRMESRHIG